MLLDADTRKKQETDSVGNKKFLALHSAMLPVPSLKRWRRTEGSHALWKPLRVAGQLFSGNENVSDSSTGLVLQEHTFIANCTCRFVIISRLARRLFGLGTCNTSKRETKAQGEMFPNHKVNRCKFFARFVKRSHPWIPFLALNFGNFVCPELDSKDGGGTISLVNPETPANGPGYCLSTKTEPVH